MNLETESTERMLINLSHTQTDCFPYNENHIAPIKGILDGARAEHAQAVKDPINKVGQMKDAVSFTKRFQSSNFRTLPSLMSHRYVLRPLWLQGTAPLEVNALVQHRVKARTLHTGTATA
jgi:hypothetical protein